MSVVHWERTRARAFRHLLSRPQTLLWRMEVTPEKVRRGFELLHDSSVRSDRFSLVHDVSSRGGGAPPSLVVISLANISRGAATYLRSILHHRRLSCSRRQLWSLVAKLPSSIVPLFASCCCCIFDSASSSHRYLRRPRGAIRGQDASVVIQLTTPLGVQTTVLPADHVVDFTRAKNETRSRRERTLVSATVSRSVGRWCSWPTIE